MQFDFEFWQLLAIPVFFGLGWVAARIDIRHLVRESRALPQSYFTGLNFLLNEQPDKAIEAFIEVVKVDPQTVELHFALGSLFRRRGEIERAIRMHQIWSIAAICHRMSVCTPWPNSARTICGPACSTAPRRASANCAARRAMPRQKIPAGDLPAGKGVAEGHRHRPRTAEAVSQKDVAHFYCELAAGELMHSRPEAARQYLESALQAHRTAVRASLLLGDLAAQEGRTSEAVEAWKRIEQQNPAYLSLVAQRLLDAFRKLDRKDEGLQLLRGYLERYPSLDLLESVFRLVLDADGPEPAYQLVREELRRNPTLLGLDKLLEAQLLVVPSDRRADLELVKNLVHGQTRRLARYRCDNCGFKARQFYWRCPACGGWETYPPRRSEEFELTP